MAIARRKKKRSRSKGPKPYFEQDGIRIYHGDCLEIMPQLEAADTCLTDPPYHLTSIVERFGKENSAPVRKAGVFARVSRGFMGQEWDGGDIAFRLDVWAECFRLLKPGAFLLSFGGTRTFHRLACAIEDAGFEIRDCMMWVYGSGFPKSHNIANSIDKRKGCKARGRAVPTASTHLPSGKYAKEKLTGNKVEAYKSRTEASEGWEGYGTALKPAWEPIIVAMKPVDYSFVDNALTHGLAGLNIDGGRIGTGTGETKKVDYPNIKGGNYGQGVRSYKEAGTVEQEVTDKGRWPANFVLSHHPECKKLGEKKAKGRALNRFKDGAKPFGGGAGHEYTSEKLPDEVLGVWECHPECPVRMLDEQSGEVKSGKSVRHRGTKGTGAFPVAMKPGSPDKEYTDTGGASRFFYCPKAGPTQRGGLHPTVKPLDLMIYLSKLTTTPTGGLIIDPFMGSGSTLRAAQETNRPAIGIEIDEEYCEIAANRLRFGDHSFLRKGK